MSESRTFQCKLDSGEFVGIEISKPTQEEMDYARTVYSKVYSKAIGDGIPPRNLVMKRVKDSGMWSDEDDKMIESAQEEYRALRDQLGDFDEGSSGRRKIEKRISKLADELIEHRSVIESFTRETADTKALNAFRETLVACTVLYADGENAGDRVWESREDFRDEEDELLVGRCVYEYHQFESGEESNWEDPEDEEDLDEDDDQTVELENDASPESSKEVLGTEVEETEIGKAA